MEWMEALLIISVQHLAVLRKIYAALDNSLVNWAITGSFGFFLQGVPVTVHDIDIQTNRAGAYMIENCFSEFVKRKVSFSSADRIQSYFGALEIDGVLVEIMGDIQKRLPNGIWEYPVDINQYKRLITVDNMQIPVLSLHYEYAAYKKLGRNHKAELPEKWLHEHSE